MENIKRYLQMALPEGQSSFLWGARKAGKSTYLRQTFPDAVYIDLLRADVFETYLRAPYLLRHQLEKTTTPKTVILDEVQKVPALLDEVHVMIESNKNLRFILCGSSARKVKTTGANLLGGRAWRYVFLPFCYPELKTLDWQKIFNHGLIPSHYLAKNPQRSLSAYIYDYILTEVQLEANIRKRESFVRFIDILGIANGEMIAFSNIARGCGVDSKTVRSYFEILEDMYLGYFLYPYRGKLKRQTMQQTPKFYICDTGIASYLRRYQYKEMVGSQAGQAFEHYIFLELMAYKLLNDKRDEISYWRTKEGFEVDFVFQNKAIKVKISTPIQHKHVKGLLLFGKEYAGTLHVVSLEAVKRVITIDNQQITIWPVQEFLEALWTDQI